MGHSCDAPVLRCPQVYLNNVLLEDRGETLLWTIQQLPALTVFHLRHFGSIRDLVAPIGNEFGLPRCKELATMHSCSLESLELAMLDERAAGSALRLGDLPELRSCVLTGHPEMPVLKLCIDAASFSGAPELEELHLQYDRSLKLQPGSLNQLTGLTKLALLECGLQTVPSVVTALCSTLFVLDLSGNDSLQLDDAGVKIIVACSQLRTLSMCKHEVREWEDCFGLKRKRQERGYGPSPWSLRSVLHLTQLPSAFCKRYGQSLDLRLEYSAQGSSCV